MSFCRRGKRKRTMDEEARKRNTDCVYFLASPLTCKKGAHCEFRHSEAARFHPRDCRYWLAGNCLNANCSFRHPPLDGKPASVSPSAPSPSKAAPTPSPAVTSLSMPANKSRAPCYFFSQGFCSKGDRCAFLHGPLSSMSAQAVDAQKPVKALACEGAEANDKPSSAVETSGPIVKKHGSEDVKPGALVTPVHAWPSNIFNRTRETSSVNDAAVTARNLGTSGNTLSSKHQSTLASSIKMQNSSDLQSVKQQRLIRCEHQLIRDELELVNYAEARQQQTLADKERTWNGTWRNGPVKEASPGFVDEFQHSAYDEELPYPVENTHFSRRSFSCKNTHDLGLYDQDDPSFHNTSLSSEQDAYECFDLLLDYDNWNANTSSKGRHRSPFYARRDRLRIKGDLRERLSKRRNYLQRQVSEINGYHDCFQDMDDHANVEERDWVESLDWAARRRDLDVYPRRLRGRGRFPSYGFRLDVGEDNVYQTSSRSSPLRSDFQRNNYLNNAGSLYDSRRARRSSKLEVSDAGAQPRLESRIYVEDCLRNQGADTLRSEIYSTSYSDSVIHPSVRSRVLRSSSSEEVHSRGSTSYDFEGPKPLRTLLQQSRKVKGDVGRRGLSVEQQEGFDREERANDARIYSNWFGSEKVDIAGRKRKQRDYLGSCWLQD